MKVRMELLLHVSWNILGREEEVQLVVRSERHVYWLCLRGYQCVELQVRVKVRSSGKVGYYSPSG